MSQIEVDNGIVHYDFFGKKDAEKTPFFCIAGMGFMAKDYHVLAKILATNGAVICMSHRDIRPSTAKASNTGDIRPIVSDIDKILDAEGISGVHVIGESYGGVVATAYCKSRPERIKSLILISSSFAGSRQPRLTAPGLFRMLTFLMPGRDFWEDVAKNVFSPKTMVENRGLVDDWKQLHAGEKFPINASKKQLLAAARFHPGSFLEKISVPTLIIYGSDDQMVPKTNSFVLHERIASSKLVRISGGGHHLCGERPFEIAKLIANFTSPA